MADLLGNIVRHYRLLNQAEKMVVRRARQLADVVGDPTVAQVFDRETSRQKKDSKPGWKVHDFVRSPRRQKDLHALSEMERHLHNAVSEVRAALVAGDKAIRLDWEEKPDRREECVGCGERKILESSTHCETCEAARRREME